MLKWWYSLTDGVKRNIFVYLLQRYLGCYFQEKISSQQFTIDLSSGTATLEKISLDVQALNELGEKQNWPLEFVDGYIDKINLAIPYKAPLSQQSTVELDGLNITVQPTQRVENVTSMFESMWNSMTSSIQLAEECAKQEEPNCANTDAPYEGIQMFANAIDSILSKVNVRCKNVTLQVEHVPQFSSTGVGLVLHLDELSYSDESANDPSSEEATDLTNQDKSKAYLVNSYTSKRISISGVSFSTVEFSRDYRTFSPSIMTNSQFLNADGVHRHEIQFGRLSQTQEIRIRLKQSEQTQGPKVSIETNLGSLLLFLSPRQVHVLLELANGIACPDMEDTSNVASKSRLPEKPMSQSDYQKIEQELQQNLHNNPNHMHATGLQGVHGWSTAPLDDSDPEDQFMPIRNTTTGMSDSTLSGHSSSMESSINSSMASSMTEQSHRSRKRISNIDTDPRTEISHFHIRLASMAIVLTHEDLLIQSSDDQVLVLSTVKQMQKKADDFFTALKDFTLTAFGVRQFADADQLLDECCKLNHLRLFAAPVQIECDEKTAMSTSTFSISGQLTVAKLELQEVICETDGGPVQHVSLVKFVEPAAKANVTAKPHLALNLKHIDKTVRNSLSRRNSGRKTDVSLCLQRCLVEVDLTILDRISSVLNPQPICLIDRSKQTWSVNPNPVVNQAEARLDLKLNCDSICLKLRFPIADYRPLNDMNRVAWFKRNVRPDYLTLTMNSVLIQSVFLTNQNFQDYNVTCQGLNIHYYESENSAPIHVAKTGADEAYSSLSDINKARLNIKIYPTTKMEVDDLNQPDQDISTQSMCSYFTNPNKLSPPFSSVKVVHESDTPHQKNSKDDAEDLVIPGNKQEINKFVKAALGNSEIVVDIFLPTLSMQLIDKHTYELIYNRINNDLLMWKPSAPQPKSKSYDKPYPTVSTSLFESHDVFKMCKSGIQYTSGTDSDDSDEAPSVFYSTSEAKMRASVRPQSKFQQPVKGQNAFALNLTIGQGLLFMNTPVRDTAAKVIPGQHGEFLLNVENANVFVVSGYNGDENLGYVCIQVHEAKLHHCDMTSTASSSPPIKEIGTIPGRHLHKTIYQSEPGMLEEPKGRGGDREMLTVAVRIMASHETHHVKTVLVAIGLNKATLRHKMCNEPNNFISHIMDFFNVQDYPIPGYISKDVITEFHLHMWDCAIDYRPLNIPLRSVVTVGNFTMSSHLSAASNTSTLIFIAEECGLFLSDKAPPKNGVPSNIPVNLKRDYVNVIELGLFELSIKTSDKKNTEKNPHFDLRASNNRLTIRTCADSGRALMQLIKYFASNGDLSSITESCISDTSSISSPRHNPEQELVSLEPQHISNLSTSQHDNVKELIGDALKESEPVEEGHDDLVNNGTKMFFFPNQKQKSELASNPLPQVTYELGDTTRVQTRGSDTDDDFCFVGNEAGLGQPEIKWLTSDSVRVIDNHFGLPTGKTDLLKPPKHFPNPVERYTLCEMTITWVMYGGHDFDSSDTGTKKMVNFRDTAIEKVAFKNSKTNAEPELRTIPVKRRPTVHWVVRGGASRDHDVRMELHLNKLRFQHELYPEHTKQASRQVLIISDVEINDRLESSQINKFLYQYTSQARPKQSHAHMVVVKAVHERQDQQLKAQECCLKISVLPLRLNIDQDSLLFLIKFFSDLASGDAQKDDTIPSRHSTPTHQPPVMMVADDIKEDPYDDVFVTKDDNYLIELDEKENIEKFENEEPVALPTCEESAPVYFRKVTFSPDVLIRMDYHGKHMDSSLGPLAGILMWVGQLNKSEFRLKRIDYRHGLLGFDKLVAHLLHEWLNEIKTNQVPGLLTGVGPMHALVQLFKGIKDLFWLPIEQYQKDGRIVRGLQRGANSFTTSTAMAALELTSRIIHLIQITAETAYDMLSPGPSIRHHRKIKGKRKRHTQPQDIREGMTNAIMVVKEGIANTAGDIVQVASHEHEQKGYSGAVGSVLRQIPPTMLKPIILATEATTNLIEGARSQLEPDARKEASQKWRSNDG